MPFDVQLDDLGDIPTVTRHVDGLELVIQRVTIRLRMALGEFLLDRTKGLDYLAFTAQRPVDVQGIGDIIRNEIASTPGVDRVDAFEATSTFATVGLALQFSGRVVVTSDTLAQAQLVALTIGFVPTVGNTHSAVITYHRLGLIAPHAPGFGGIT